MAGPLPRSPGNRKKKGCGILSEDTAREIFLQRPSRNGNGTFKPSAELSHRLSAVYGVAERSVREIWNRKLWASATRPLWTDAEVAENLQDSPTNEASGPAIAKIRRTGRPKGSKNGREVNHKLPFPLLTSVLLVPGRSGGGPVRRRGGIKAAAPEVEAGTSHVESQSSFPALQLSPDLDFFPPSEPKIASCAWSMPAKHPSCDDLRVLSIEKTERGGVYEPSETQDGEFWDPFEADWQRLLHGFDFKTMLGFSELAPATELLSSCCCQSAIEELLRENAGVTRASLEAHERFIHGGWHDTVVDGTPEANYSPGPQVA